MPRKRKAGPRTKSGRLKYRPHRDPELRDKGTHETQAKRHALINGADPQLAATASGILLANGMVTQDQHAAAMRYAYAHAMIYGKPWNFMSPLAWDEPIYGSEPSEDTVERAQKRIDRWNGIMTPEQRQAVANVAVFGFVPQFFYVERLQLRVLNEDVLERQALVSGLEALARD